MCHSDLTRDLNLALQGNADANNRAFDAVYADMRRIASRFARESGPDPLQPTAVVHEAYIRLVSGDPTTIAERRHFFALAARAMRDITVERYRRTSAVKRGGRHQHVEFEDALVCDDAPSPPVDIIAVSNAIRAVEARDRDAAEILMLRYFGGLRFNQVGELLGLSRHAVRQRWAYARSLLLMLLDSPTEPRGSHHE